MTVSNWIRLAEQRLAKAGLESSRLEGELLLAHVLRLPRLRLVLEGQRELSVEEFEVVEKLLERRRRRVPSQHLLGTAAFLEYELQVNTSVLIPRPETEGLAILGIAELRRRMPGQRTVTVLDFGTGSGALILSMIGAVEGIEAHALDISVEALAVARENARRLGFENRVQFHLSDRFSGLPDGLVFDLILANPPYIPTGEIADLAPEVRDFDPQLALDGGLDGLDFYRYLAIEGKGRLISGGCLMMEMGDGQRATIAEIFGQIGWSVESVDKDLSGRDRVLIVRRD